MPYRFKIDEPVEKGFRRIAREQLEFALTELAAPQVLPKGVHECRKALKRIRALVRLASPGMGYRKARRRGRALSEIARLLSARRDQAVMLETLAKLTSETQSDAALVLAPLRAHLTKLVGEGPKPLDADCAAKVRLMLLREAQKFARTRFRRNGFAALEGGLEESYRKARKAMKNAYGEPSDENFHTLRKAAQWHWRQMSLLARAWPEEFAVRVTAAHDLSQMLGDDHDLAMLIGVTTRAEDISAEDKEAIVALCAHRQRALRNDAEPRAERLFAEKPKAFTKRMAAYWRFGRAVEQGRNVLPAARTEPQKLPASIEAESRPAAEPEKAASTKPRLAAKAPASAPSQRRA
jgi:CHAD domain-containing protein